MKLILILAGTSTSKIVVFGAQKTRTNALKSRCSQNESLFGADFGPEAYLIHFSWKMTVNIDHYRAMLNAFLFKKFKRRILATLGSNRTALRFT